MFLKLFKYEWKANIGLFRMLSLCVLGISCVAAVLLRILTTYWDFISRSDGLSLLLLPAFICLFCAFLALAIYGAGIQYLQLFRFYKSRFTDEGYLTFTLPVKTSHIFLSTALHMLIWGAISVLVIAAAFIIAVGFGPAWAPGELQFMWEDFRKGFSAMVFGSSDIVVFILFALVSIAYSIVVPLSAVVVGSVITKKHKVLAIIGILYGISVVSGIATSFISVATQFLLIANNHLSVGAILLSSCAVPLILTVAAYPLSIHLMKNKLNLP